MSKLEHDVAKALLHQGGFAGEAARNGTASEEKQATPQKCEAALLGRIAWTLTK